MIPVEPSYLPKRIRSCPECGDTDRVQYIAEGMPAHPPTPEEEDRILFVGCVVVTELDDRGVQIPPARWHCPACDHSYR